MSNESQQADQRGSLFKRLFGLGAAAPDASEGELEQARQRAIQVTAELRSVGWLLGVNDKQVEAATAAALRDLRRSRRPENGALEREILLLDPRTRNAAIPESIQGDSFELQLPNREGNVCLVPGLLEMPEGRSGPTRLHFLWLEAQRVLALRSHDGLFNRGLALRGLNRLLALEQMPWRFYELLVRGVSVIVLDEGQGHAVQQLMTLPWVQSFPSAGADSKHSQRAVRRAQRLREIGILHPDLPDDLVRRAFTGERRFLDNISDASVGNFVAVLDGLRCFHVDLLRAFDSERNQHLLEGLFTLVPRLFDDVEVTDLDSTPTEEGRTEIDLRWGEEEYRIYFDQEHGVIEMRLVGALNELLDRHGEAGRFHALAPVLDTPLLAFLTAEQRANAEGLLHFAPGSLDPKTLAPDDRLEIEVLSS